MTPELYTFVEADIGDGSYNDKIAKLTLLFKQHQYLRCRLEKGQLLSMTSERVEAFPNKFIDLYAYRYDDGPVVAYNHYSGEAADLESLTDAFSYYMDLPDQETLQRHQNRAPGSAVWQYRNVNKEAYYPTLDEYVGDMISYLCSARCWQTEDEMKAVWQTHRLLVEAALPVWEAAGLNTSRAALIYFLTFGDEFADTPRTHAVDWVIWNQKKYMPTVEKAEKCLLKCDYSVDYTLEETDYEDD